MGPKVMLRHLALEKTQNDSNIFKLSAVSGSKILFGMYPKP